MGRLILIIVIGFVIITGIILLSTGEKTQELPDSVANTNSKMLGKRLGNYALGFGVKQLIDGNVSFPDSNAGYIKNFTAMEVSDGIIDSIVYSQTEDGAIAIDAYTTYTVSDQVNKRHSSTKIAFMLDDTALSNITAAIISGGSIELKAHAVIEGTVIEDSTFDFEATLGMTQQEVIDETKANNAFIEYPANNEPMPDSLTWMDGELKIQSYWEGAGVLIVNGDMSCTAQINFEGILIVFGTLDVGAHSEISGSVFVIGDTSAGAHATISFDPDAIEDALNSLPVSITYEILEWNT